MKFEIPSKIQCGGQKIDIMLVDSIEGGSLGESLVASGFIKIADNAKGFKQSEESKLNTFVHECVHVILDTAGYTELSQDEKLVCTFAGFATELIKSIIDKIN